MFDDICYCSPEDYCPRSDNCLRANIPDSGIYTISDFSNVCHCPEYDYFINEEKTKMYYESKDEMVSHPKHYQSSKGLEVIDVIEAFTEGLEGIEATDTGNIIKYACRWKDKNGKQDLEKIIWYARHLIDHLEEKK